MDWLAGILELLGMWRVGSKNRKGFILGALGNLCWIAYVVISNSTHGLLVIVIPAIIINIRNFILWRPGDRTFEPISRRDVIFR